MQTSPSPVDQPTMPRWTFFRLLGTGLSAFLLTGFATSCAGQANDNPVVAARTQKVDFTVQLNAKGNESLNAKGGYVIVNDILVAQTQAGQFVAVSAGCTQDGTKLVYRAAENQFYCAADLSRYDITGKVIAGPATRALQQYTVASDLTAGTVRVFN